jgi:hypothetical protein
MIYSDVTQALALLAKMNDSPGIFTFINAPNFSAYLPRIIDYAEGRCYREITPLATRNSSATTRAQAGLRTLPLIGFNPQPIVVEGIALITPVGTTPTQGQRWQYEQASIDFIDMIWPVEGTTLSPSSTDERYWGLLDNQTIILAPTPDQPYTAEATGTFRPTPLSALNPSTYLSLFYPDIFLAACMIAVAGFQRDYGAQSDDPKMAVSWESQYESLKAGAIEEEQRRRGQAPGASNLPAAPELQQRRG